MVVEHGFVAATFVFFGFLILLLSSRPPSSSTSCSSKASFNGVRSLENPYASSLRSELRELDNLSFVISISKPLTPFSWSSPCSSSLSLSLFLFLSLTLSVSSRSPLFRCSLPVSRTIPACHGLPTHSFRLAFSPRVTILRFPVVELAFHASPFRRSTHSHGWLAIIEVVDVNRVLPL